MARLFVAIDFAPWMAAKLIRLQPPPCAGLRMIPAEQLHLTLHFIGEAAIAATADALQTVRARPFDLRLAGLGQFRTRAGVTLWAGVEVNDALLSLHHAVAVALSGGAADPGLTWTARPYRPHITLARCKSGLPAVLMTQFLEQELELPRWSFGVSAFSLYSSVTDSLGAVYRCEQVFALQTAEEA